MSRQIIVRVATRALLAVAVLSGTASSSWANSCAEIFSKAGQHTIGKIDAGHPEIGIRRTANGYSISSSNGTQSVASIPALLAALSADVARGVENRRSLELYFQDMDKREAMNLVSTLRLRAAGGTDIEAFAHSSSQGRRARTQAAERASDPGELDHPSAASSFQPLSRRYDWTKARVEEAPSVSTPTLSGFSPEGYSFRVRVPTAQSSVSTPFKVSVFFKQLISRPSSGQVASVVEGALRQETMNRATVQRAARAIIGRIEQTFPDTKAIVDVLDLVIVELKVETERVND